MISRNCRCTKLAPAADLLPWADPYILQLFQQAELAPGAESDEMADLDRDLHLEAQDLEGQVAPRDPWCVTRPRRPGISRRRRTEFALQLAPC
jgi:hypothetical protein